MAPKSYELGPGSGYNFFMSQLTKAVYPPKGTSVTGQAAMITGGNVGIGRECGRWLLELGLEHLILAVRTISSGEATASELRTQHPNARIDVWQVDMLSYKSVQELAARCGTLNRLDIAILNAGMMAESFELGPEGHEKNLQLHYLSTVLLSVLLLPALKVKSQRGRPGRLTIVGTSAAYSAKFPTRHCDPWLPSFNDPAQFTIVEQYTSTKGLPHFWLLKLVEFVKPEDVVVNLVDPGYVKGTSLHRNMTGISAFLFSTSKAIFGRSLRTAATTYLHAAIVTGIETHGSFLVDWRIRP
jgi:NAD(P)-dependent dehydrogenase (short-subunit alcohol dehydrogenase family)